MNVTVSVALLSISALALTATVFAVGFGWLEFGERSASSDAIGAVTVQTVVVEKERVVEVPAPETVIVERPVEVTVHQTVVVERTIAVPVPQTVLVERIVEIRVPETVLVERVVEVPVPQTVLVELPNPAPSPVPSVEPSPTPRPTAIPTPSPVPEVTPGPTPIPSIEPWDGEPVVVRQTYGWNLDLPDSWTDQGSGRYRGPGGFIQLFDPKRLFDVAAVSEFSRDVKSDLPAELPIDQAGLQSGTFVNLGDHQFEWIAWPLPVLSGEHQQYGIELVGTAGNLPGPPLGIRVRACCTESPDPDAEAELNGVLRTLRLTADDHAGSYYQQFVFMRGVTIKADATVSQHAMSLAADLYATMLAESELLMDCLDQAGTEIAIYPHGERLSALPEFSYLGSESPYGQFADTIGGTPEEDLLRSLKGTGETAVHEFAHAVHSLCMSNEVWTRFLRVAEDVHATGRIDDTYASTDPRELFAEFSTLYFDIPNRELLDRLENDEPRDVFPSLYGFLDDVYKGDAAGIEAATTYTSPPSVTLAGLQDSVIFDLSRSGVADGGDFDAACRSDLGLDWRLADFEDLRRWYDAGGDLRKLITTLRWNLDYGEAEFDDGVGYAAVSYQGGLFFRDRQYFAQRHDHEVPGNFLVHDDIADSRISLGSWYGDSWWALCVDTSFGSP